MFLHTFVTETPLVNVLLSNYVLKGLTRLVAESLIRPVNRVIYTITTPEAIVALTEKCAPIHTCCSIPITSGSVHAIRRRQYPLP